MSLEAQQTTMATVVGAYVTAALLLMITTYIVFRPRLHGPTRPSSRVLPWIPFESVPKALKAEQARLLRLEEEHAQLRAKEARALTKNFEDKRELDIQQYNNNIDALAAKYKEELRAQKERHDKEIKAAREAESARLSRRRERGAALNAQMHAYNARNAPQTTSQQSQLETKQAKKETEGLQKQLEKEREAGKAALEKHREEIKAHQAKEASQAKELEEKRNDLDAAATRERQLQDENTRLKAENESNQDLERQLRAVEQRCRVQELQREVLCKRLDRLSNGVGFQANATENSAIVASFRPWIEDMISETEYGAEALDMRQEVLNLIVPAAGLFNRVEGLLGEGNTQAIVPVQTSGPLPQSLTPAGEEPAGPQKRLLEAASEVEVKATDSEPGTKTESVPVSTATASAPAASKPAEPAPTPMPNPIPTVLTSTAPASTPAPKPEAVSTPSSNEASTTNSTQAGAGAAKSPAVSASDPSSAVPSKAMISSLSPRPSAMRLVPLTAKKANIIFPWKIEASRQSAVENERVAKHRFSPQDVQDFFDRGRGRESAEASPAQPAAPPAAPTPAFDAEDDPDVIELQAMFEKISLESIAEASSDQTASSTPAVHSQIEAAQKQVSTVTNQAGSTPQQDAASTRATGREAEDVAMSGMQQQPAAGPSSQSNPHPPSNAAPPARSTGRPEPPRRAQGLEGSDHAPGSMVGVQSQELTVHQMYVEGLGPRGISPNGIRASRHAPPSTDPPPRQARPRAPTSQTPNGAPAANGIGSSIHAPKPEASQQSQQSGPQTGGPVPPRPAHSTEAGQQPAPAPVSQTSPPTQTQSTQSQQASDHEMQEGEDAPREVEKAKNSQANSTASTSAADRATSAASGEPFRFDLTGLTTSFEPPTRFAITTSFGPTTSFGTATAFGPTSSTFSNLQDNSALDRPASRRQKGKQKEAAGQQANERRTGTAVQVPSLGNLFVGLPPTEFASTTSETPRQSNGQAPFPASQTGISAGTSQQQDAPMPEAPAFPMSPAPTVSQQQGDSLSQRPGQAHADSTNGKETAAPLSNEWPEIPNTVTQAGAGTAGTPRADPATASQLYATEASNAPAFGGPRQLSSKAFQIASRYFQHVNDSPASAFAAPNPPAMPTSVIGQQGLSGAKIFPTPESTPTESRTPADSPQEGRDAAMDDVPLSGPNPSGGFSPSHGGEDTADDRDGSSSGPGGFSPLQPGSQDEDEDMKDKGDDGDDDEDDDDDDPMDDLVKIAKKHDKGDDDEDMDGGNASSSPVPNNTDGNGGQSGGSPPSNGAVNDDGNNTSAEGRDEDDMDADGEIDDFEDVAGCRQTDSATSDDIVDLNDMPVISNTPSSGAADTMTAGTTTSQQNGPFIPPMPANIIAQFGGQEWQNRVLAEQADEAKKKEDAEQAAAAERAKILDAYLPDLCDHCQGICGNHLPGCSTLQQEEDQEEEESVDDYEGYYEDDGADYPPEYCEECNSGWGNHQPSCSKLQPTGRCSLCNGIYGQHNPGCERHHNAEMRQGPLEAAPPPPSTDGDGITIADCTFQPCGAKKGEQHIVGCQQEQREIAAREKKRNADKAQFELGVDGADQRVDLSTARIEDMKRRGMGQELNGARAILEERRC